MDNSQGKGKVQTSHEFSYICIKLLPQFPIKLLFGLIEIKEEFKFNWYLFPWLQIFTSVDFQSSSLNPKVKYCTIFINKYKASG